MGKVPMVESCACNVRELEVVEISTILWGRPGTTVV